MTRLLTSLVIIIGSLIIGQVLHAVAKRWGEEKQRNTQRVVDLMRNIAFFGLIPFTTVNAFWIVDLSSITIIAVPLLESGHYSLGLGWRFDVKDTET